MNNFETQIFKQGSKTYYFSSIFFPKSVKKDVFKLYSFVRTADDYVDRPTPNHKAFYELKQLWDQHKHDRIPIADFTNDDSLNTRVIKNIIYIMRKYQFEKDWIEAFFGSMQRDLENSHYQTLNDTLQYVYGSAEVVGLMMARIMGLPKFANQSAKLQGRAMQYVNFLRDIDEDVKLGRCYFPQEDLEAFGLKSIDHSHVISNKQKFEDFMLFQLKRYYQWQNEAYDGFKYIPFRLRLPLKTAVDMYNWTAAQIALDPLSVYRYKHKPTRFRVIIGGLRNLVTGCRLA